ncbi:hypothetical protein GALMADRAFT_1032138 [Galerina marginata CBS 339.88]|uniref:Uncharacterized protein n=1 Tax=Galerina marginata (strain CBS 339.88) TaxID=685588 RepID=A0A067SD17_GALM3|nr:hypothetical protein GALMADRAFT_1032138 [Galerina marginata CBS 339.88]
MGRYRGCREQQPLVACTGGAGGRASTSNEHQHPVVLVLELALKLRRRIVLRLLVPRLARRGRRSPCPSNLHCPQPKRRLSIQQLRHHLRHTLPHPSTPWAGCAIYRNLIAVDLADLTTHTSPPLSRLCPSSQNVKKYHQHEPDTSHLRFRVLALASRAWRETMR